MAKKKKPRKRYENTRVSVGSTRESIAKLLTDWGVVDIMWGDQPQTGAAEMRFRWQHEGAFYTARFNVPPTGDDAKERRRLHRALLHYLKGVFVAVEDGILDARTVFLPFLEAPSGQTFGEVVIPRLGTDGARALAALSS